MNTRVSGLILVGGKGRGSTAGELPEPVALMPTATLPAELAKAEAD